VAALIYLHSTDERQREIADALGDLAAGELKRKPRRARGMAAGSRSGTQRARSGGVPLEDQLKRL
jgi:hypothetical protein